MAEFEIGVTIVELSKALETSGHALFNQGTYDGQTFWGAVSTSTHGSGLRRDAFPEMVLSFVLVGEGGRTCRVEPKNGVTDPADWREPGIDELIFERVALLRGAVDEDARVPVVHQHPFEDVVERVVAPLDLDLALAPFRGALGLSGPEVGTDLS